MAANQFFNNIPSMPTSGAVLGTQRPMFGGPTSSFPSFPTSVESPINAYPGSVPGAVPPAAGQTNPTLHPMNTGAPVDLGGGFHSEGTLYPTLSNTFAKWLQSQIGQGATPFNLATPLPTGGSTLPGQLSPGMNPLLQQLFGALQGQGGGSLPGFGTLETMANQGISALPAWQSMVGAQQQNIAQNQANLREQFAGMGGLAGSPFGNAMSNYMQQTTADQNSLLGQMQLQGMLQGQLPAAQFLTGMESSMGQYGQQLDQQSIDKMYNEFIRTRPEYNPLLGQMFGLSTTFAPMFQGQQGSGILGGIMGGLGDLLAALPAMGGI